LLGTDSIVSRYMHSADDVLLAVADVVDNATMKLMASDQVQRHIKAPGDRSWLRC